MSDEQRMDRSSAIDKVIGYLTQIEGEWGSGGSIDAEAAEVLTALGVTRDELVAHNVIKDGYYYHLFLRLAEALADPSSFATQRATRSIAESLDHRDPVQREWRTRIFEGRLSGDQS